MKVLGALLARFRRNPAAFAGSTGGRHGREAQIAFARSEAERHLSRAMPIRVIDLPTTRGHRREVLFCLYMRHKALFFLYDELGRDPLQASNALSARVVERIVDELAADFETDYAIDRLVDGFASEPVLRRDVPDLIDGRLTAALEARAWSRAENQARLADLRTRDATTLRSIAAERDRIAAAAARIEQAVDVDERAGCIWELEAAQDRVRTLKRRLLVPLEPQWQDDARIDRLEAKARHRNDQ